MPPEDLRLLLVEDSPDDAALVQQALRQAGLRLALRQVDSAAEMVAALSQAGWDLVISDYNLPGFSGTDALRLLREHSPDTPFIVVSGCIGEEAAVSLMKAGADDYVMKDNLARLVPAVERSLKEAQTRAQRKLAQLALRESEARFKAMVSNIPGTVLQLRLDANGSWSFSYLSEGCLALCGVTPRLLQRYPGFFFDLIVPEDSVAFAKSMQASARELTDWNWEGRIHVSGSEEVKWVNLRSSPRRLDDGSVLWEGILSNITQGKLAELQVRRSREDLSRLSAHVESIKEHERARIAREIHDDLGGTLTAIKIELMRLGKDLAPGADQALQHLRSTEALVDGALETTRRISTELRPGILDLGIVAAMEWQAAEFEKRMDMPCRMTCAQEEIPLEDKISIALFRIFQETLTNIAKHAGATRVEVELEADADCVTLQVHDNGRGIAAEDLAKPQAFGILGMQERALHLGGSASVRRTRSGTALTVRLPRSTRAAAASPADDEQPLFFGRATSSGGPDLRSPTTSSGGPDLWSPTTSSGGPDLRSPTSAPSASATAPGGEPDANQAERP
jgi:signal transduction histidine kinase/CheY-like chemotaxis protein